MGLCCVILCYFVEELPCADDAVEMIVRNIRLGGICLLFKQIFTQTNGFNVQPSAAERSFWNSHRAADASPIAVPRKAH